LDLDAIGAQRPKTSQSKVAILEEEINRLGMLLKAEQHTHEQTKINAQLELDRYRQQLDEEKDLAVKGVIDEYMRLNLEQRDRLNREQMDQSRDTSSEIRRLENELKDTQVAFDLFQANCRDDFEIKLAQMKTDMATVRKAEVAECNEKAEARLKARLGEQRGELEADFADSVLRIEHKQKQEIETMMAKLNSSNDDLSQMRETEAKATSLNTKVERQTQRIIELEKANKDHEKKTTALKAKIEQWELNSKSQIERAVVRHAEENEKLMNEVSQLRMRLVAKAETIGAMQFNHHKPVTTVHNKQRAGSRGLKGILNIKQLEENN